MLIAAYNLRVRILFVITYIDVIHFEFYILVVSFLPLYAHHFLNSFFNVKVLEVMPEFIAFDLWEVQQVLNDEIH